MSFKEALKLIALPMILGAMFYFFVLLGYNYKVITDSTIKTWIALIAGTILMYFIVFGAITNKDSISVGIYGFYISKIVFGICAPVVMLFLQLIYPTQKIDPPKSLLEKENVVFIFNNGNCFKAKYGTFITDTDTIIRYLKNNRNYEIIKSISQEEKRFQIRWLDSCSYARLSNNNAVVAFVQLGNFENNKHQMYSKPGITHYIDKEKIITVEQINNAP